MERYYKPESPVIWKLNSPAHSRGKGYKKQVISFGISKGERTVLNLEMEKAVSFLVVEAPGNTGVFYDGEKLPFPAQNRFEVQEGEHILLFRLGDYKLSKKIEVAPGKTYKISLLLDILMQED